MTLKKMIMKFFWNVNFDEMSCCKTFFRTINLLKTIFRQKKLKNIKETLHRSLKPQSRSAYRSATQLAAETIYLPIVQATLSVFQPATQSAGQII